MGYGVPGLTSVIGIIHLGLMSKLVNVDIARAGGIAGGRAVQRRGERPPALRLDERHLPGDHQIREPARGEQWHLLHPAHHPLHCLRDVHRPLERSVRVLRPGGPGARHANIRSLTSGSAPGDSDAGRGIRVALIDSGVDPAHPLLAGRVAGHASFDRRGERDWGAEPVDASGHGSHTAGIVAQLAPGAALLPARAVEGGAVIWRILAAIDWAIRERADIVAMPVGVPGRNPVLWPAITALRARAILPVAAIGNTGAGVALAPGWYPHVLAVGAADSDGLPLKFSGSVNEAGACLKPDLLAPGAAVVSAAPGGGMVARSGTSMAAAMVAGTVAVLMQRHGASAEAVEDALLRTATPVAAGREHRVRCGVLAAAAADRRLGSREADPAAPGFPSPVAPAAYCHPRLGEPWRMPIRKARSSSCSPHRGGR